MNSSASAPHSQFATFAEFYPFYLSEHRHPTCRRLHFTGTLLVFTFLLVAVLTANPWWLLAMPISGYSLAWVGHFFFETNRPGTFSHPFYSFAADFVLFRDILTGRIRL